MKVLSIGIRLGIGFGIGLLLLVLAVFAQAESISIVDDRGKRVQLDRPPQRIVSLLPSLTETVCALGACDKLVGVDRFSNWPESVTSLPGLGGLEDARIERVLRLAPDLVLVSPSARVIDRFEELGLKVAALDARDLAETRRAIDAVALLIGRRAAADELHQATDRQLEKAIANRPVQWDGARVYFEVSEAPFAAGESSFIGELLGRLRLINIVPAALGPFPKLNPEFVVRARPEIVIASSRNLATMGARPGWSGIPALSAQQVCAFEPAQYDVVSRPGPRLAEAMSILVDCLQRLPSRKRFD